MQGCRGWLCKFGVGLEKGSSKGYRVHGFRDLRPSREYDRRVAGWGFYDLRGSKPGLLGRLGLTVLRL